MAAYRRVYDSRHLQADCQEQGPPPEPYARQSNRLWTTFALTLRKGDEQPVYTPRGVWHTFTNPNQGQMPGRGQMSCHGQPGRGTNTTDDGC